MSGGIQGVQGRAPSSGALLSAAGQGSDRGQSSSPAERFQRAVEAGPLSPSERAAFRSQLAKVAAQDEQRRAAPSPQLELAA